MRHIFWLFVFTAAFCTSAMSQDFEYISYEENGFPSASVDWREVYGRVTYKVYFSQVERDAKRSLESFLKKNVRDLFGNESGSYILTLSVYNGPTEIAKKAIVSFIWSQKKFLFFTRDSDIKSNISFSGHLIDHFPVTSNNNRMQVKLELQKMGSVSLDVETFNKFSEQVSLLSFESLQPAISIVPALKASINVMATVLNETKSRQLSSDISMMFINKDTPDPNKITYSLRGPTSSGKRYNNGVFVEVSLDTDRSIVGTFKDGKFEDLDINFVLQKSLVGATGSGIAFADALSGDQYSDIRGYMVSLEKAKAPDDDISLVCGEFWETIGKFFSIRDAPAVYAAYLSKYEAGLNKKTGAKLRCIDKYKGSMEKLGIPYSNITITQ